MIIDSEKKTKKNPEVNDNVKDFKMYCRTGLQALEQAKKYSLFLEEYQERNGDKKKERTLDSIYLDINRQKKLLSLSQNNQEQLFSQLQQHQQEPQHFPNDKSEMKHREKSDETHYEEKTIDESDSSSDSDLSISSQTSSKIDGIAESNSIEVQESIRKSNNKKSKMTKNRKKESLNTIKQQLGKAPCLFLPYPSEFPFQPLSSKSSALEIPSIWVGSKSMFEDDGNWTDDFGWVPKAYLNIARNFSDSSSTNRYVIILLLKSGRFAGAVFSTSQSSPQKENNKGDGSYKVLAHRCCQRYTVRGKQGGSQKSNDNSKSKAKSIGAQLRRAGEEQLRTDIKNTLEEWHSSYIQNASHIFVSCPNTMTKDLFPSPNLLDKKDPRVLKIPLNVGRPTYENTCAVFEVLSTFTVLENYNFNCNHDYRENNEKKQIDDDHTHLRKNESKTVQARNTGEKSKASIETSTPSFVKITSEPKKLLDGKPFTPLHKAAGIGDWKFLEKNLELFVNEKDIHAGELEQTPLHLAATADRNLFVSILEKSSDYEDEISGSKKEFDFAKCVSILLLMYKVNPCVVDKHLRVPYKCCTDEKVRDEFRIARHKLGEAYCLWDKSASHNNDKDEIVAKVDSPLTPEVLEKRKKKLLEKKKKQRQKQKLKKQQKREEEENEKNRIQEQQQKLEKETAEILKAQKGYACDSCRKICPSKKKMFHRMEFSYCSTECVNIHKRELMAAAALARFGG